MNLLKPIRSFTDVQRELYDKLGNDFVQVFTLANTDYTITHGLRRVPIGWKWIGKDTYGNFKEISKDKTTLVLQCNTAATTATIRVF